MPIEYELRSADTEAWFTRDETWIVKLLRKVFGGSPQLVPFSENDCKILYEQACDPRWTNLIHTPTQRSKEEMRKGHAAIQEYKKRNGIPLDTDTLGAR